MLKNNSARRQNKFRNHPYDRPLSRLSFDHTQGRMAFALMLALCMITSVLPASSHANRVAAISIADRSGQLRDIKPGAGSEPTASRQLNSTLAQTHGQLSGGARLLFHRRAGRLNLRAQMMRLMNRPAPVQVSPAMHITPSPFGGPRFLNLHPVSTATGGNGSSTDVNFNNAGLNHRVVFPSVGHRPASLPPPNNAGADHAPQATLPGLTAAPPRVFSITSSPYATAAHAGRLRPAAINQANNDSGSTPNPTANAVEGNIGFAPGQALPKMQSASVPAPKHHPAEQAAESEAKITIQAEKRGAPLIHLQDGRELAATAQEVNSTPTVLAAADFDSDGVADLVTADRTGALRFYRGNADSLHPNSAQAKQHKADKTFVDAPFYASEKSFALKMTPDFLEVGDFNADGKKDVLALAKGDNRLHVLWGDGRGNFSEPSIILLPGAATALAVGEIGQADGQTDVAVAIQTGKGSQLLVFEHPEGAFKHAPEILPLPAPATDIALGNLDGDFYSDIAVATSNELVLVHERGQAYPWDLIPQVNIKRPAAVIASRTMPFKIAGLAIGKFGGGRQNALALLSDDGSLHRLDPVKPATANATLPPAAQTQPVAPKFLPSQVVADGLALMREMPLDPQKAKAMMVDTQSRPNLYELRKKSADEALAQMSKLSKEELAQLKAASAAEAEQARQRARAAFLGTIAAQPSTLAQWNMQTLIANTGWRSGNSSSAKKMITARISVSGKDDLVLLDAVNHQLHIVADPPLAGKQAKPEVVHLDVTDGPVAVLPLRLNADGLSDLVVLRNQAAQPSVVLTAPTMVITVNDTGDQSSICANGETCTLRGAIEAANNIPGSTIAFDIPGAGVHTISPFSELPVIVNAVTIDGTTQPGYTGSPLIEIKGNHFQTGNQIDGLKIRASNCVVRGLVINEFPSRQDPDTGSLTGGNGLTLESTLLSPDNGNNIVEGNYLGTDPTGTLDKGNQATGLNIFDSDNNTIGGTAAAARNIISGNGSVDLRGAGLALTAGDNNLILGNYIGIDATGEQALGNSDGMFLTGGGNQIGGDAAGAGNVISGNGEGSRFIAENNHCFGAGLIEAILFEVEIGINLTLNNLVKGNKIGTNASGTLGQGNCTQGILTNTLTQMFIGSITESGRNVISDNRFTGITLVGAGNGANLLGGYTIIAGNNISTNITGTVAIPNNFQDGCSGPFCFLFGDITMFPGDDAFVSIGSPGGTTPGGPCTGFCNLISGGDVGLQSSQAGLTGAIQRNWLAGTVGIFNNYIGTDRNGTLALPNNSGISAILGNVGPTFIGGAVPANPGDPINLSLGNLISGNHFDAIDFAHWVADSYCQGNLIGTDVSGNNPLPNDNVPGIPGASAIYMFSANYSTLYLGGPDPLQRNVISGNGHNGAILVGNVAVKNNYIGTNKAGTAPLPNQDNGLYAETYFGTPLIGGAEPGARNLIQHNGKDGLVIIGGNPGSYCQIVGNTIANNVGAGIHINPASEGLSYSSYNQIGGATAGERNIIVYNGGPGVLLEQQGTGNNIQGNSILNNGGLGIDLSATGGADGVTANDCQDSDAGANNLQNFPVLAAPVFNGNGTVTVPGSLASEPVRTYRIDFYSSSSLDPSNYGEGENFIGSINVTTNGDGTATFDFISLAAVPPGSVITATATNESGGTSEFSCAAGLCTDTAATNAPTVPLCPLKKIVVNSTGDGALSEMNDNKCKTDTPLPNGDDECTLRAAIQESMRRAEHGLGRWDISFAIPGSGVQTISPATQLPAITRPLTIDGATQQSQGPGSHLIEISGASAGASNGLTLESGSDNSTINELTINHFQGAGISVTSVANVAIKGCYLGLNSSGSGPGSPPNQLQTAGLLLQSSTSGSIGGLSATEANLISGNQIGVSIIGGGGHLLLKNKIGTNKDGTAEVGNQTGLQITGSDGNEIGGSIDNDGGLLSGNLISGNHGDGVVILSSKNNFIKGNFIGLKADGQNPLPNLGTGITLGTGAGPNLIGGSAPSRRNVISGHGGDSLAGVLISKDVAAGNQITGNFVGTNAVGDSAMGDSARALGNTNGIWVQGNNSDIASNRISGNSQSGILISPGLGGGYSPSGNKVRANLIGTVASNKTGIYLAGTGNNIGATDQDANVIVDSLENGIEVDQAATMNNISKNLIGVLSNGTDGRGNRKNGILIYGSKTGVNENTISANTLAGIRIEHGAASPGSDQDNTIAGNFIGTTRDGSTALANNTGIVLTNGAQANTIRAATTGDSTKPKGNVISGNTTDGIRIGTLTSGNLPPVKNKVIGNLIGTNAQGTAKVPNKTGIFLSGGASENQIGYSFDGALAGNVISGNNGAGILIGTESSSLPAATANTIQENCIGVNAAACRNMPNPSALPNRNGIVLTSGAANNVIGGILRYSDKTHDGNLISGNLQYGIVVCPDGPDENGNCPDMISNRTVPLINKIQGNVIGLSGFGALSSAAPIGNQFDGIYIKNSGSNLIGGDQVGSDEYGNVICGNTQRGIGIIGALLAVSPARQNQVIGNYIGVLPEGAKVGNSVGIRITYATETVIKSNWIGGNTDYGLWIVDTESSPTEGQSHGTIIGNLIGVAKNRSGMFVGAPNGPFLFFGAGVLIEDATNVSIGVADAPDELRNVIADNWGDGLMISGASAHHNTIFRNLIGLVPTGAGFPNGECGIRLAAGTHHNVIGRKTTSTANIIANNGRGVCTGSAGTGNEIDPNIIYGNQGLGIDLDGSGVPLPNDPGDADTGPNNLQNYPEFISAQINGNGDLVIRYKIDSAPGNSSYGTDGIYVEFFKADASLQGKDFIGSTGYTISDYNNGAPGIATFNVGNASALGIQVGDKLVATATDADGNTSEFTFVNVGVVTAQPTAVKLVGFTAVAYDTGVLLRWQTGFEVSNLGFNLYREINGQRTRITPQLIAGAALSDGPSTSLLAGHAYTWADTPPPGQTVRYWLEDIDLNGKSTFNGPYAITAASPANPAEAQKQSALISEIGQRQAMLANGLGAVPLARTASLAAPNAAAMQAQTSLASQSAVKLSVKQEGYYRVTQSELIAAGLSAKVDPRLLQLFVDGVEQSIKVVGEQDGRFDASDAVEFYGLGLDTPATDAHIYWLVAGTQPGKRIPTALSKGGQTAVGGFPFTVERRDRTIYFAGLRNGEAENFFGAVIASQPVDQTLQVQHLNPTPVEPPTLEVSLQGVTLAPHSVRVQLNGTEVTRLDFTGQASGKKLVSIPSSLLREGENIVRLITAAGPSDISLVDRIRLTYTHTTEADHNALRLTATAEQQLSLSGFTSRDIRLLDVTDANAVQELATTVTADKGGFKVSATVGGAGSRLLLAFADSQVSHPATVVANQPSSLRQAANGADLLLITQRQFFPSVDPLKSLRQSEGLSVAVVDIEDIYDEFGFGNQSPQAVKDFIAYAASNWKKPPRYLLLAGDASYDARNYLGLGESDFVPTKLIDTTLMETASDDWFADFNNDGVPELAVGRLPFRNATEAATMIGKLASYNQSRASEEVLLVADLNDGFNFEQASAQLVGTIPSSLRANQINRGHVGTATAKAQMLAAITRGQKVINYAGHGSVDQWRDNLLKNEDATQLQNAEHLSVFVMMTCLNGYFDDPLLDSLAESLLKAEKGGAVAVWASSGMTLPAEQAEMNQQFYRSLFSGETAVRLGEATRAAKATVHDVDVRRTWVLIGDPSMRLK